MKRLVEQVCNLLVSLKNRHGQITNLPHMSMCYGCTGGELSHLFVSDLGNGAGVSVLNSVGDTATQIANLAMFSNVQSYVYWSGTEYAPDTGGARIFRTDDGFQGYGIKIGGLYAVAVRPGDVAAVVPEPQAWVMLLLGLAGVVLAVRKRTR